MEIVGQLQETRLHDIKQTSESITGSIRINPKNYTDAFISNPDGGPDIYIEGARSRNAAMEGDIVQVKLNHYSAWKINRTIIANRWDEWSAHLLPIIEAIELAEQPDPPPNLTSKEAHLPLHSENQVANTTRAGRKKRDVSSVTRATDKNVEAIKSKLPSNLPVGISKLQVSHIIHLPFSSKCIQKTGVVVNILKRTHQGVAGGFLRYHSPQYAVFSPTDSRIPRMLIPSGECPQDFLSQSGRYKDVLFVAQLLNWDNSMGFALGTLIKIIGDSNNIQSRMEALLLEHQVFDEDFGPDAYTELNYLNHLPSNWIMEHSKGRRDLTDECVFTIDPKTARDLDDAVSIRQIAEQIYEVGVHIADVSYFVKELTAVDYYARLRTTSVYLVDRVIPMLPRVLCEQMCSLNPGEPKLTFSVIWKMDKYGHIIDQWFGRTVIKSCAKLAYEQAQDLIDNPKDISWIKEGINMPKLYDYNWKYISKSVVILNKIAQNLRAERFENGALRIDQVKLKFELDSESGFPSGFSFESRTSANYLIEEYMLLANMAVAKKIYQFSKEKAFLRRHPISSPHLLKEIKEFCDAKGCPIDITSSGSIQKSLNMITDPTMLKVISFLLLRAMKNAEYICVGSLPDNDKGFQHFALNVPFYTHFTSPIRRYADIIVHRLLALALKYETISNEDIDSETKIADECTKRKISSKLISDTSQKWYFNLFVQKAGFCELLACVIKIQDMSFDVILVNYDRQGRVYLDKLKPQLESMKFESHSGIKRLVLNWKPTLATKSKKNRNKKRKKRDVPHEQVDSRTSLELKKLPNPSLEMRVNEAVNDTQVIQVFDVIRVIVTVDEKDITQLRINLKSPSQ